MNQGGGLYVAHFDTAGTTYIETLYDVSGVAVRWALPLGLQRFEFTIRAKSRIDAYQRYTTHQGDRFLLLDHFTDRPIADGYCYEVVPNGYLTTYIIANKRHTDQYETDNPTATDTTDVYIKSVLTNHVPSVISDQSNIAGTGLVIGEAFAVNETTGDLPLSIISNLAGLGNSSNEALDYYLVPQPLSGGFPQDPLPYLVSRTTTNASLFDWQVGILDLAPYGFSRHIWDLANDITIYYTQTTTLTANAASGATALTVASIAGFSDNDEIEITLDSGTKQRTTINGAPAGVTINIDDPLTDPASGAINSNLVAKLSPTGTTTGTDTDSQARYWLRELRDVQTNLNQTQANALRDLLLSIRATPTQQTSFVVSSGMVQDANGARYPVWRMLINPGKIRLNDIFPVSSIADLEENSESVFRIVALDYNHDQRSMTVTPDNTKGSARLDVILQQAGIEIAQIVDKPTKPPTGAGGMVQSKQQRRL